MNQILGNDGKPIEPIIVDGRAFYIEFHDREAPATPEDKAKAVRKFLRILAEIEEDDRRKQS